jgi:hypothetical protein
MKMKFNNWSVTICLNSKMNNENNDNIEDQNSR